jgi:hypothetical protein
LVFSSAVVALTGSVLVSSSPGGPAQQAGEGVAGTEEQGVEEAAKLVDGQRDQTGGGLDARGFSCPFSDKTFSCPENLRDPIVVDNDVSRVDEKAHRGMDTRVAADQSGRRHLLPLVSPRASVRRREMRSSILGLR